MFFVPIKTRLIYSVAVSLCQVIRPHIFLGGKHKLKVGLSLKTHLR
jgi:hypothetical protein